MNFPSLSAVLDAHESGLPVAFVFDSSLFDETRLNDWERERFGAILEELSAVGRIAVCLLSRRSSDDSLSDDDGPPAPYLAAGFEPDEAPDRAILRLMRRLPSDVFLVFVTRSELDSALEEFVNWVGGIHLSVGGPYPPLLGYHVPDVEHLVAELAGFIDRLGESDPAADRLELGGASFQAYPIPVSQARRANS